jgi:phosphinothricin acetyltransferase
MSVIRAASPADADAIARIYNHYISNTIVTFEESPLADGEIADRIGKVVSASLPWIVLEQAGQVAGYAYASKWQGRSAYRFSVESTWLTCLPARTSMEVP